MTKDQDRIKMLEQQRDDLIDMANRLIDQNGKLRDEVEKCRRKLAFLRNWLRTV